MKAKSKKAAQLAPTAPIGALLLRLILVFYWASHWWFKIGFKGMTKTVSFFDTLGLPAWLAWFDVSFEMLIVVLLLLGVFFRFACLSSLPILIVSMFAYGKNGFYFPGGGIELPIFWALVQATLVLIGPGAYSIQAPIKTKSKLAKWFLL